MDLGDGPSIFMAARGGPQKLYRPGESVGQYKILAIANESVTLEWDGKQQVKRLEELRDRSGGSSSESAPISRQSNLPPILNATPTAATPVKTAAAEPGIDISGQNSQMRACNPGDTSPAGTTSGGFRKVITSTPFGQVCRWEPVR
jgi:hypothetical protein